MTTSPPIKRVVIVGGGTAGWMTAAGLISLLGETGLSVTLVESEAIGIVGVGEATLPHIRFYNSAIGIDEAEFMRATSATFKLGIEFVDWARIGDAYIHPFGDYGLPNNGVPFFQYWRKMNPNPEPGDLDAYSLPIMACRGNRFNFPHEDPRKVTSTFGYAYQFDATKFAPFLRQHAEARRVHRIEGKVVDAQLNADTGDISSLTLESGETLEGDLFIDCSGFVGLLIEKALKTGYDEWTEWLPCDRAVAVPCAATGPLPPYTRATAGPAGWRWRIPLQHRNGNGHVYSSAFLDDQLAEDQLIAGLDGELLAEPRKLRFVTGKRKKLWNKNCIAVGLAGGFLEPLESTSIYLIQEGITKLLELFPSAGFSPADRDEYNSMMDLEFERIRDFLILHYHATERDDSPFWNHLRTMTVPDSLSEKMELFNARGRVQSYEQGVFRVPSWIAVYAGQRRLPEGYDLRVDHIPDEMVAEHLARLKGLMAETAAKMPDHSAFLRDNNCAGGQE